MKKYLILLLICQSFNFCSGNRPENLGIKDNKLTPCPETPNCVSSFSDPSDKIHFIEPIPYTSSSTIELDRVKKSAGNVSRSNLIKEEKNYLYFEFTSLLMRYVDDVEFYFDDSSKLIHVRSASRLGTGDFDVNRKRIETLKEEIKKLR